MSKRRPDHRKIRAGNFPFDPRHVDRPSFESACLPTLREIPPRPQTVASMRTAFANSPIPIQSYLLQEFEYGECSIFLTREYGLLHISISHPTRDPTWNEIAAVRYALIPDDRPAVMILPPREEYLNRHEHCFHVWEIDPDALDRGTGVIT